MAKYLRKEEKKRKKGKKGLVLVLLAVAIAVGAGLWISQNRDKIPLLTLSGEIEQIAPTGTETQTGTEAQTGAEVQTGVEMQTGAKAEDDADPIVLSNELQILYISDYAGIYMEDGTNEVVSDVMMILVENVSDKDLQLARINLVYAAFTAQFEITNLPAGEKIVVLEKNRHSAVTEAYQTVELKNVAFFEEPMNLREETLQFSGSNGLLEVKNISGEDIPNDIYVYYKNSAVDLLYGGITYRVVIEGGLPANAAVQVISGHYSPENSRVVSVEYGA